MVIFFKSSSINLLNLDPAYIIYMGKDKFENEELLKYAFPIDVWFHVDNLSSAHVYLRLPESVTIDTIDKTVLEECCQVVKDNSIEGKKKDKVVVCYTPYENLLKTSDMEIGAVTFKKKDQVRFVPCSKNKDILKVINKTFFETKLDLETEKENYLKEQKLKQKKLYEENVKKQIEENKINKSLKSDKKYEFMDILGQSTSNKSGKNLEDDFW